MPAPHDVRRLRRAQVHDELCNQPRGEDLHPDHHAQHAQNEQRPLTDRLSHHPQHAEVAEYDESTKADQRADATEKMRRPPLVLEQEEHREQVHQPAEETPAAELADAELARVVLHHDFPDFEALPVRQHRNEAVHLAVQAQVLQHHGAVRFEAAVHVVEPHAGEVAHHGVEDARRQHLGNGIVPLLFVAGDEVEAFVQFGQEARNFLGVVLQVRVQREHDFAARFAEAGGERGAFAEVALQLQQVHLRPLANQLLRHLDRAVSAAVVHEPKLVVFSRHEATPRGLVDAVR